MAADTPNWVLSPIRDKDFRHGSGKAKGETGRSCDVGQSSEYALNQESDACLHSAAMPI